MKKYAKEDLYKMTGPELIKVAEELGVTVRYNHTKGQLTEPKAAVIERILKFDETTKEVEVKADTGIETPEEKPAKVKKVITLPTPKKESKLVPMPGAEKLTELKKESTSIATPKRGQLIEFNGKAQNICAWAKELGVSANTLYGRLYKLNWSVEKAFGGK